jgi:hypothetical protein
MFSPLICEVGPETVQIMQLRLAFKDGHLEKGRNVAPRLTVIICQSPVRDSHSMDVEEALLAELMMTPGLDATLVGALENIAAESTDCLCLSSFSQSLALLSWASEAEVRRHWQRLELSGHILTMGQRPGDSSASAEAHGRRLVYFFAMQTEKQAILNQLRQLLVERSVQTVSLALPASSKTPPADKSMRAEQKQPPVVAVDYPKPPTQAASGAQVDDSQPWTHLDRLVDDFDALDL